jgi:predicted nucleic acid-binding protein
VRILVDTCVWSEALRRAKRVTSPASQELQRLISQHRVEIIGPIRQEILSSLCETAQFDRLETILAAFPDVPLRTEDYITAAKFFNLCRKQGVQGSNTDFLICAVAMRHQFALYTTDKDFQLFSKYIPIIVHRIKES